jgi:lipopolysaccharide transport system ATP-binding protein
MSKPAIVVDNIGKAYRIGVRERHHDTLRDMIAGMVKSPFERFRRLGSEKLREEETLWALRNVSFEIGRGEVVGIIGRNGAGKSTLLKVLSRITEPTEGCARLRGRVASLLEVGTGFHPELTGRENIYLNGSILGMSKVEIDRKFDEIVGFSGVERFLETPVKRYSSGMYVRLAFAVAAHLEPEILIVDEVLAVGDAEFQKKCLGKMQEVATGQGRTVLFVSHNMSAVQKLCPRALLMRQGRLMHDGPSGDVVREYLAFLSAGAETAFEENPERSGNGRLRLTGARILDDSGHPTRRLVAGRPATFEYYYDNPHGIHQARVTSAVFNHHGMVVTNLNSEFTNWSLEGLQRRGTFRCHLPRLPLPLGGYRVSIGIEADGERTDSIPNVLAFDVESSVFFSSPKVDTANYAACLVDHEWQHEPLVNGADSTAMAASTGADHRQPVLPE